MSQITVEEFCAMKPSQSLIIALHDFDLCESDTVNYGVNMLHFIRFVPRPDDKWRTQCFVCLAGSILAKRFDHNEALLRLEDGTDSPLQLRLRAIDKVRTGSLASACRLFGVTKPEQMPNHVSYTDVPEYDPNQPDVFKRYIKKIIAEFKSFDL